MLRFTADHALYCEGIQLNKNVMVRATCLSQWEPCLLMWGLQQNMLVTVGVTLVTMEVTAWTCCHDCHDCHDILKYKLWAQGLAQTLTPESSCSSSSRTIDQHLMDYLSTPIAPSNKWRSMCAQVNEAALHRCYNCRTSRPYRDAQDRLLWRDLCCMYLAHRELESV